MEVFYDDITKVAADVIINAANTELRHGGGVALAIARAAGEELVQESQRIGFAPLGSFAVTTAGDLPAKKVVHIPTIDYTQEGKRITYEELEKVWQKVLKYCQAQGFKTIVTPLLGAGVVGLEGEKVKKIIEDGANGSPDLIIILVIYQKSSESLVNRA